MKIVVVVTGILEALIDFINNPQAGQETDSLYTEMETPVRS
jgi:hypothetical protein